MVTRAIRAGQVPDDLRDIVLNIAVDARLVKFSREEDGAFFDGSGYSRHSVHRIGCNSSAGCYPRNQFGK